jgi:hypothetical protein
MRPLGTASRTGAIGRGRIPIDVAAPLQRAKTPWIMAFFRAVFALFALGGFLGLVWLVLYVELEACERLADVLDPMYHWQVVHRVIAMPLFWGLAILTALGIAWMSAESPEPPSRSSSLRSS